MHAEEQINEMNASREGILLSRPSKPKIAALKPGQHSLPIEKNREAWLYVPKGYKSEVSAPLALMLHGAGGNAHHGLSILQNFADESGIILLAPKSKYSSWDVIADDYGVDVHFIDQALTYVFQRFKIEYGRLAVGGFSDGASYALCLGIINGNLFTRIIAFSPGFMAPTQQEGKPEVYISHGTEDRVLPIERCSRRIVPQLKGSGYKVIYREFDGPHTIPPEIATEAVEWLIK